MPSSRHSPAPWHHDSLYVRDAAGEYVADIELDPEDPVAEANARLIAAAPDLLDALRNLVAAEDLFVSESGMKLDDLVACAVECARLAIAKAEGR